MGTGYTRQSAADIVASNEIQAGPLNSEFNQLRDAFDYIIGHAHDGTTGEGPKLFPDLSLDFTNGFLPDTNGTRDIGSGTKQWNTLFLDNSINWGNGDVTTTYTANTLTFAGATSGYVFNDGPIKLPSGGAISWNSGALTLTHSTGALDLEWADNGATAGPDFILGRNSASAATSDAAARLIWRAKDDAGVNRDLFKQSVVLDKVATASYPSGIWKLQALGFNNTTFDIFTVKPQYFDGAPFSSTTEIRSNVTIKVDATEIGASAGNLTVEGSTTTANITASGSVTVGTGLAVSANDGGALGTGIRAFSDLFLASGGVINLANGDVTITHSTNTLTFAGASSGYIFDNNVVSAGSGSIGSVSVPWTIGYFGAGGLNVGGPILPSTDDVGALGSSALKWSDLFLASGSVINFNSGDVTLTHSADALTMAGGNLVFSGGRGINFGNQTMAAYVESTYSPTVTAGANIAAVSNSGTPRYQRVGNWVTVWGRMTVDPTAAATFSDFTITLPIASDLGAGNDLLGVATQADTTVSNDSWGIVADTTNDVAIVRGFPASASARVIVYTFTYRVI